MKEKQSDIDLSTSHQAPKERHTKKKTSGTTARPERPKGEPLPTDPEPTPLRACPPEASPSLPPEISPLLLRWYRTNARKLPWRQDQLPYHVWLSEVMLQQTRVETVKGYYLRFLERLPNIAALAAVSIEELYKLWEGLGYYSRAKNLQKAAQMILRDFGGVFPGSFREIQSLPGIGPYTAGAISSICFQQPTPAVDGNVLRVISRLLEIGEDIKEGGTQKKITAAVAGLYPREASPDCGALTQALIELGALVCVPKAAPLCDRCPLSGHCRSFRHQTTRQYPVTSPKKQRKQEDRTVLLLLSEGRLALSKRPAEGLLSGLWELPNIPVHLSPETTVSHLQALGLSPKAPPKPTANRKHIFTHIEWHMIGYLVRCQAPVPAFQWVTPEELSQDYALPTAFRQFLPELQRELAEA